ncbi:MAG: dihydropteroate synthase [Sphingobium sp.]
MIDPASLPPSARLYLRPIWFADSPVGLDGQTARLGNGLLWFQGYEVIVIDAGGDLRRVRIPVEGFGDWVAKLPDALAERATRLIANIAAIRPPISIGQRVIRFDVPQVMGILNMTPDSFSDDGKHIHDPQAAADSGFAMGAAGAVLIDVGGESTRPGADPVWEGDEIARVVPVIERLSAAGVPVSVDTRKAGVMEAALAAGAGVVNDVSALLHDPRSMEVVVQAGCPVILMHAAAVGDDPHENPAYGDVVTDVFDWLAARIDSCVAAGIARERIIVDPGLGFGKTLAHNLGIINRLSLYQGLGVPVLLGASRKRMIGALSNEAPTDARLAGSIALAYRGAELGAQMLRVHDVSETVQAMHVWRGLRDAALVGG